MLATSKNVLFPGQNHRLVVIGIVFSALDYCTGDTESIPSCSKDSKSQLYQCPTISLDSYSQWREMEILSLKVFGLEITM